MVAFVYSKTIQIIVCFECAQETVDYYVSFGYEVTQILLNITENQYIILMEQPL